MAGRGRRISLGSAFSGLPVPSGGEAIVDGEFFGNVTGIVTVSLIFGGWIIVAVVSSVAKNWRKVHESEHLAVLKQSMIERGMSADEIERVLRAGPEALTESASDATTELSKKLAEHGVAAPAMEQILNAFHTAKAQDRKTLSNTVLAMLNGGAGSDQVLAAVRALSRPSAEPTHEARYRDDPASFRN
jgi:hypothetical protein